MYFSSSRQGSTGETTDPITGESYMDIWVSTIDRKGNWGQPTVVEGINTADNEGTLAFDSRGKTMFFTRCPVEEKMRLGCDIYTSEKKGKGWGEPTKLSLKDHDSTHVGHPCISPDGKTLIFSSNMAGGYGGVDLWMSTYNRREDTWSLPVNLGPEINTPGNDVFPTWGPNNELYYATDGLVGMGGLDLYVAPRVGEENKWSNPTNLMSPINSCRDDYHIFFTESGKIERGFFSSNRNGSKGEHSQDIWDFYLPPVLIDVLVMVHDQETGEPIANMPVTLVGSDGSNYTLKTDASGQINLGEYLDAEDNFTTVDITSPTRIIRDLKVLNIAKPIRLPEVRYDLGSAVLQVIEGEINSKDSLNYLYNLMIEHPNLVVELGSHTDSRGSATSNQKLSQARAQSCIDYLVNERGLPADRFVPKGYGENVPATWAEIDPVTKDTIANHLLTEKYINTFKTSDKEKFEMLHQLNRRTECKILSMDYVAKEPEPGTDVPEGGDGN
jgi:outer membrane protein OmpA-like peptidoglycan-associated protein